MIKKIILCVIISCGMSIIAAEKRKPITELDMIAHSIEYTVRNPIKVTVVSYLIINQLMNGKNSLPCQGYKWLTVSLPKTINEDKFKLLDNIKISYKSLYDFLKSSFVKNPQV